MTFPDGQYPPEAPRDCSYCSRLVAYRHEVASREPDWFNGAVPSFGDPLADLLVVGLAPGVTGANRTGRPFTGDWAGDLLYATLGKFGFSEGVYKGHPEDGLVLKRAMITNAVRCVPPQNKPVGAEINRCRPFLETRLASLPRLKVILCLGKISHESTVRALGLRLKDHPFGHGTEYDVGPRVLLSSYHCSRYNTNTRRLTPEMFEDVFRRARERLEG
ncbi:MAG: uracil-DNA glycosylase [Henriciella sp.]|jgi:uracil-DNA glycosylase family 4